MKETFLLGEEDLGDLAKRVSDLLIEDEKEKASVILLEGDLGAGKTTFTKALAHELGIGREEVHSPTFILKKEYSATHPKFKRLVHVDAYRFTHPDEAKVLRLEDDLNDPRTIVVVEWPSKMSYLVSDIELDFKVHDESLRDITLSYEKR